MKQGREGGKKKEGESLENVLNYRQLRHAENRRNREKHTNLLPDTK